MKKLKKLKLKKEVILSLNKGTMQQIVGGGTFDLDCQTVYWPQTCLGCTVEFNCQGPGNYQGTNDYCGTLNNCGTGATYCITNDCFFNSKPCY